MIKGINRQIIEVCDEHNRYFERILLFVRPGKNNEEELQNEIDTLTAGLVTRPPMSAYERKRRIKLRRRKNVLLTALWCLFGLLLGLCLNFIIPLF